MIQSLAPQRSIRGVLEKTLQPALKLLEGGERLVEIRDAAEH